MINLIINELINIFGRKKTKIFLLLEFVLVFICYFFFINSSFAMHLEKNNFINYVLDGSIAGFVVICVSIILTSDIIVSEFSQGTIRQILIRPKSRFEILFSKIIAIYLLVILQYLILLIPSLIIGYFAFDVVNFNSIITNFMNNAFIGIVISTSLSIMIGLITYSTAISVVIPIGLYCIGQTLSYTTVFHPIYKYYIYYYVNYPLSQTEQSIVFISFLTFLYFIIFIIISFITFQYRDVK